MTSPFLRRFRIVFSAVVLICFFLVFIDFRSLIPAKYINYLLYLQFIPSAVKYFNLKTVAAAGFLVVVLSYFTFRPYLLFIPVSAGYRTGYIQQDRRKDQEKIQEVWV